MPKAKSPKKTANTNGDAHNLVTAPAKQTPQSALQTSSADANGRSRTPRPAPATDTGINEEQIRRRAYELYTQRGGGDGRHVEDWFRAEAELLGRR